MQQRFELVNHILQPAAEIPGHPSDSSAFGRVQYTQHEQQTYLQLSTLLVTLVVDVSYHPLQLGDDSTHTHKANTLRIKKLGSKIAGMDRESFFSRGRPG